VLQKVAHKFAVFEEILSNNKWLAGADITYVDFLLWEYLDEISVIDNATLAAFPILVAYHKAFLEIPQHKVPNFLNPS
jgi:glutathione S-transferase